jgi:hypothetical protein
MAEVRNELATAGLADLSFWLEIFDLQWCKVVWVAPADVPWVDLPTGIGVTQFFRGPETKSDPSQTADVLVMASKTVSGFDIGRWLQWVRLSSGKDPGVFSSRWQLVDFRLFSILLLASRSGSPTTQDRFPSSRL